MFNNSISWIRPSSTITTSTTVKISLVSGSRIINNEVNDTNIITTGKIWWQWCVNTRTRSRSIWLSRITYIIWRWTPWTTCCFRFISIDGKSCHTFFQFKLTFISSNNQVSKVKVRLTSFFFYSLDLFTNNSIYRRELE